MTFPRFFRPVVLAAMLALVVPFAPMAAAQSDGLPLDTELTLVTMAGQPLPQDVTVSATFGTDGQVGGFSGCNQYGGPYTAEGTDLSVGPLLSTRMACPDAQMQVETTYLALLEAAASFSGDETNLIITTADGQDLVFTSPGGGQNADIVGVDWTLTSVEGTAVPADVTASLLLGEDGQAGGSAGCNSWFSDYSLDGSDLSFGLIASTMMFCEGPAMDVETPYLAALQTVATWSLEGSTLTLADADGRDVLVYANGGSTAVGSSWTLVTLAGQAPPAGTSVTLALGADDTLSGSAGCNTYSGSYTVDGSNVTVGPLVTTRMACPDAQMSFEADYLAALSGATSWALSDGRLVLTTADGEELVYAPAEEPGTAVGHPTESTPLAGTTWSLTGIGGMDMPFTSHPWLVLGEDGTLSGNGGCNDFHGSYSVSGDGITIGPLASTRKACTDVQAMTIEQTVIGLLPSMVQWSIEGDILTLQGMVADLSMTFEAAAPQG